jgi:outer membrane protein assembly factor BamD
MAGLTWTQESGWQPTRDSAAQFEKEPADALRTMNDARLAQKDGQLKSALSKYAHVCKKFPASIFAPEAYFQTGKIKLESRQFNDAFKAFNTIVKDYPRYERFNDVLHEEFEIARLIKSGERPKYFGVIPGFKNYDSAIKFYKKIVSDAPFSDIAPLALVHIGELAINRNKLPDAIAALDQLVDEYPYSEYTPDAYLKLGKIYASMIKSPLYDQGATKLAMDYYEDFLTLYPNHDRASEARAALDAMRTRLAESKLLMGDFYFNARNNAKAAVMMYRRAAKSLPGSEVANLAEQRVSYIRDGNLPKKTPVDFLFGRYVRPDAEKIVADASSLEEDGIDLKSDLIRVNSGDGVRRKTFANPDIFEPDESFLQIGPQKEF